MTASYPSAIKSFTTKVDNIDYILAAHVNDIQNEVTAIETELGTDPKGTSASVKEKIAGIKSAAGATADTITIVGGNVGINKASPSQKLDVVGNITASGNVTATSGYLQSSLDGSSYGVLIGSDTQLYRDSANVIRTPDSLAVDGNIYTAPYTEYSATSTVVGWGSTTVKRIFYKTIGKLVFVQIAIAGTSDAATTSITLPFSASNVSNAPTMVQLGVMQDNGGAYVAGMSSLVPGSNVLTFAKDISFTFNSWTASGTKSVRVQFFYEAA